MLSVLLCVLLIGYHNHVQAVVNKASSQVPLTKEEEKPGKAVAGDRISNTFASLSEEYGPPSGFNGPAPVYGPPELVGNLGPTAVYPPPPAELPPPVYGVPVVSYGLPAPLPPPRSIKPQYVAPLKQSFTLLSTSLLPKPSYGPPKLHYGLPKQHFTSFPQFRLPKPQYTPALKFVGTSSQYGPFKAGHGPPIPISLETYGPPPPKLAIQFNPLANDEYGPPPAPQPQYGPPAGDLYEPPPPAPPPGVPAPPTPPDIKYDGWQPIAGLASSPNQSGPPTDTYGPPTEAKRNYAKGSSSSGTHLSHASLSVPTDSNVPSDSYGVPIHNPEAQDLKTSVHQSSESNGLPPPPLPQQEPLHNNQGPGAVTSADSHQYGAPNIEPLSIVKTVGFELLPTTGPVTDADLHGLSLSDVSSFNHVNSASLHSDGNNGDSHGFQNAGLDLPPQTSDYGAPFNTFAGVSPPLLSPPPLDTYGAPPLSSYSPNGPYPVGGRGAPPFFGAFGGSFHKQNLHHSKAHAPFRPPVPLGSLIPPRNRDPIKFREPIPTGLLSNINRYVPAFAKQKLPSIPLGQQLPSYHAPVPFRYASGPGNSFSGSLFSAGYNSPIAAPHVQYGTPLSFTDFNTPAPQLTYGAPNFGPPTSYVSTFSGFGRNLYSDVGNALTTTYGVPLVNDASLAISGGHDCNSLQPLFPSNVPELSARGEPPLSSSLSSSGEAPLDGQLASGLPAAHSNGKLQFGFEIAPNSAGHTVFANSLSTGFASTGVSNGAFGQPSPVYNGDSSPAKPFDNFLGGPSVNTLDLQHNEQQKVNLKDSYGNPVGVTYDASNEASKTVHATTRDVSNEISAHFSSQNVYPEAAKLQRGSKISPEAFTASLTAQSFGRGKNLDSNEVDAGQFLKSSEGSEALSLAQRLTANNAEDFEIQGSKGTYTLQIQPANGGFGTENSDGGIRHDHVLSDGLLQNIIAAIERPGDGPVQLQGPPESQLLKKVFDNLPEGTDVKNHLISSPENCGPQERSEQVGVKSANDKYPPVALFFNAKYGEGKNEIRLMSKSETQVTKETGQSKTQSL
ncbi:PREDICTED: methyl-CpG-binding domain protein 6-like isoform X2 [Dinoponera quadriceps]|nr:PREDICTED: methyl-CpG-binding domain protein 6-like isoform X2 [Dinoponera quadriceps]